MYSCVLGYKKVNVKPKPHQAGVRQGEGGGGGGVHRRTGFKGHWLWAQGAVWPGNKILLHFRHKWQILNFLYLKFNYFT